MSKLRLEKAVHQVARDAGLVAVIGRFTNLYGPGQDLRKPQGLVSHLCRAHVTGAPIGIYVPLDTLRDYLYVEDAASLVTDVMERAATGVRGTCTTKILGSQHSVSVGALLGEAQRIFRRPVPVLLAASRHASLQAHDLRVNSVVWPDLDRRTFWTLPAGIAATAVDVQTRMLAGRGR
jgi:UDP-glucose 4-epimerase